MPAPGNRNESPLLRDALPRVIQIAREANLDLRDSVVSLDGVYDCRANRKAIFNRAMVPNINPNPRGRKRTKRGRKPLFDRTIFKERFRTIERVFPWETPISGPASSEQSTSPAARAAVSQFQHPNVSSHDLDTLKF
ncbi:hypothetical protein [Paraburkholderia sp. MM6662-R1]|uniref:hypothetical protein n=1 Tax=Paraburkholderia sp. MM6662-R1 TaxID=2991066 RepID=UPI003D22C388